MQKRAQTLIYHAQFSLSINTYGPIRIYTHLIINNKKIKNGLTN